MGLNRRPAEALGGGTDRGGVLGGQVLDALGVRRGPGGRCAVVVAEPASPERGVHRGHRSRSPVLRQTGAVGARLVW
jgi:hypothetical protein